MRPAQTWPGYHMVYGLNFKGDHIGDYYKGFKGDSKSLDYSSYGSACRLTSKFQLQALGEEQRLGDLNKQNSHYTGLLLRNLNCVTIVGI